LVTLERNQSIAHRNQGGGTQPSGEHQPKHTHLHPH